jgi:uncharacterized tellurite resistance protein B-like protein
MANLKDWISRRLRGREGEGEHGAEEGRRAAAALMVEVLRADFQLDGRERRQVIDSLRRLLGLDDEDCRLLADLAERQAEQAHDLYQFTSQVNQQFSIGEKVDLVEQLWRIARADDVVHKYEEHLIRRIAELLHVPHRAFIAAKIRAGDAT